MWSALVADRLGIISHARGGRAPRADAALTLETMERHEPSGQFYNWYDHTTGAKLTAWPPTGDAARRRSCRRSTTAGSRPGCTSSPRACPSSRARPVRCSTAWTSASTTGPTSTGSPSPYAPAPAASACCYDTIVSESRIASYIGIATGEIPAKEYFGSWRTFPDTCDWSWQETQAARRHADLPRRRRLRGRLPVQRHADRPGLGRQHVRGAHAGPVRARGGSGARTAGRSTIR